MKEHLTIYSTFDNLPLDVLIIGPSHPKGIIQIAHGMCEHKERYLDFISYLNKQGYVCCIHDHRGHGKSVLHKDDLGYFYKDGHIAIVEDLHQLTMVMKKRYPLLPVYLIGHSMGSLVVRCFMKRYDYEIDGLFVCGSPSKNPILSLGIGLTSLIQKHKGEKHRSLLIQRIGFDAFNKNFGTVPNSWICSHPKVVEDYNNDPLCTFIFTTNGFLSLFYLMKETYDPNNWKLSHTNIPIHFIAGENDPCITNTKKFNEAVHFMKDVGYQQTTSKLFKDMRHEILNEKHKKKVYQHIIETIKSWEK